MGKKRLRLSGFGLSDEKWNAMTDAEKAEAVRSGWASTKQVREGLESNSADLRATCEEAKEKMSGVLNEFAESVKRAVSIGPLGDVLHSTQPRDIDSLLNRGQDLGRLAWHKLKEPEDLEEYKSASALVARLHERYLSWTETLPVDVEPAVFVILANGIEIRAIAFAADGFNDVVITGEYDGKQCMVVTHQASLQVLWLGLPVAKGEQRRAIGFMTWPVNAAGDEDR